MSSLEGFVICMFLVFIFSLGFTFGDTYEQNKFIEVCKEAQSRAIKLQSCGYYKWEAK